MRTSLLSYAGQDPARYPLGVNVTDITQRVWTSPDLMVSAACPNMLRIQAVLAEDYVPRSGVMKLAGDNPFTVGYQHGAVVGQQIGFLNTTSGIVSFYLTAVGGSPYVYLGQWGVPANDSIAWPAGTYINHYRANWQDLSHNPADWPVRPELVVDGRRTGYPAGMGAGQSIQIAISTYLGYQAGTWTVLASGTGVLQVVTYNAAGTLTTQTVTITAGVASGTVTVPTGGGVYYLVLAGSSDADPLHDVRVICPDRPGHADNFVATYRANAADPKFLLFHPDFVNSLKPFSILRFMDLMGANNNPMVLDWADRPIWNGIGMGINRCPYEYLTALCNAVSTDAWICLPITVTDDYATNAAAFFRDNLDPRLKLAVERANEIWNSQFAQYYYAGRMSLSIVGPSCPQSITYAGGLVTVVLANHGFADGAAITTENATDGGYSGTHAIAKVDANTFTFAPSTAPGSGVAVAKTGHNIFALDAASRWALPAISSIVWDGRNTITVTTATAHNLILADHVQLCGAADDAYNGQWSISPVDATRFNVFLTDSYNRPMPTDFGPGSNAVVPRPGQQLRAWRVASTYASNPGAGLPYSLSMQSVPYRLAQVHTAFHDAFAGQTNRLINIVAWQMPFSNSTWQFTPYIDRYLGYLGGHFLPDSETAFSAAPYLINFTTNANTYLGFPKAIASLTSSGGVATATTAAAHGYPAGATVQVSNVLQPQYCGLFAITVTGTNTFTYPVPGSPVSPASTANGVIPYGMAATLAPPYARELTAVSVSGTAMSITSPGHGWATGQLVHLCAGALAGADYKNPAPALYGPAVITATGPDTFTATLPAAGPYTLPGPSNRMWAWDDAALGVLAADLAPLTILSGYLAGLTAILPSYPGATIRCYEGGASYGAGINFPVGFDMTRQFHLSQANGDLYKSYISQMYGPTYRVKGWCQFNHVSQWGGYGFWGVKEYQHAPNNPEWLALMDLCDGVPDYADGGQPPMGRRWSFASDRGQF